MRNRTIARELAIQALYQIDLRGDEIIDEIYKALLRHK